MNAHLLGLVLALVSGAAIIAVLVVAGWRRESAHITRAQRDARFGDDTETAIQQALADAQSGHWDWDNLTRSPSTEQAIAQALSVSGQPASWAGTLRRKDGAK